MADTGDFDPVNDALSIYTGTRLPQSRGAWPTLPEFRPSAQRVWELPHSRPYDPMNPGMSPEAEDAARVLANPKSTATERTVAMATLAAVLTQGKVRPGAKLKGQTRPNIPAWSFPEGYKPELQGGFGLKSLEAIKQMREGNVRDNPVRVEYVANELRKRGISDAEIEALKLDQLLAKGPMIKRSDVEAHIRANRPEIQHAYYQGKEGQAGVLMMKVSDKAGPDYMRDGIRIITYKDPRSGRVYEMHRSGLTNDAGPQDVMKVKDVETGQWLEMPKPNVRGGQDAGQQFEAPASHRFDEADAFQALRNDIKQRTSTIPPGAVGGTRYAGGNYVLDATAPHQEHAWGLGPNKEWAEAQARHKQLYAEQAAAREIVNAAERQGKGFYNDTSRFPEAAAALKRSKELEAEIAASDKRLSELNSGRYEAGHIRGPGNNAANQGAPWDYLTHSRVAPVEFQAQGTRIPGTLVEERQSDRYQQLRDRGARASPEAIEKARQAWNDAQVAYKKAEDEAKTWVSNVNPDKDWRYEFQHGSAIARDSDQADVPSALQYLHDMGARSQRPILDYEGKPTHQQALAYKQQLDQLREQQLARHGEYNAAKSGVPGHPLINTAEAFNRFAAKTELLQAAKNAHDQGLPESASYWIGATPGPEQNARYGKSQQVRGLRLDTRDYERAKTRLEESQKAYNEALLDPETAKPGTGVSGRSKRDFLKDAVDEWQATLKDTGLYKLQYRPWYPPGRTTERQVTDRDNPGGWSDWHKPVRPDQLPELFGPDLSGRMKTLLDARAKAIEHNRRVGSLSSERVDIPEVELNRLPGSTIGGQAFDRTYGDNAFTPGTVNDTLHAQLRKLDPNTPEWTTANILQERQREIDKKYAANPELLASRPPEFGPPDLRLVQQKRTPYGHSPSVTNSRGQRVEVANPPVEVRAHEMTPEARRKINEQGFSLFQLPIAAGIGASALAGSMLNQYGDPEDQQ